MSFSIVLASCEYVSWIVYVCVRVINVMTLFHVPLSSCIALINSVMDIEQFQSTVWLLHLLNKDTSEKYLKVVDMNHNFSAIRRTKMILICVFVLLPTVPGAPPRRVEVEVLNSTALKVMWRSLTPGKQHGQIRGYQVHYVRVENGESRGLPLIKDVMLADAQV